MRTLVLTAALAGLPVGCIVYDTADPGCRNGPCIDEGGQPGGEVDEAEQLSVVLTPPQAEVGETFIGYLSAASGQADFRDVVDLVFYGDVVVQAQDAFANQVILSLAVPDDAEEGEVDLVVEWADGSATWVPAALTIWPAGSGHSAAEWSGDEGIPGEGGGTGGGSGSDGTTGSGSGSNGTTGGGTGGDTGGCP